MTGTRLVDRFKFVPLLASAVPAGTTLARLNLANYNHVTFIVDAVNSSSGITASAITLNQSQDVGGTGSKALPFAKVFAQADVAANGDALVETNVASNTFTITNTASKTSRYVIEVDATTLDVNNGFGFIQLVLGNAANQTVNADAILSGARQGGNVAVLPTALS